MGTHPIFESDFDCLTDETEWEINKQRFTSRMLPKQEYVLSVV